MLNSSSESIEEVVVVVGAPGYPSPQNSPPKNYVPRGDAEQSVSDTTKTLNEGQTKQRQNRHFPQQSIDLNCIVGDNWYTTASSAVVFY